MLKSEVIDFATKQRYTFSYFEDDTINVIRQQIAIALNTHPDRLFILVSLKLDHEYYQKDPRRWEALFNRLSYNQQPITDVALQEYVTTYRSPPISLKSTEYDKTDWISKPEELEEIYSPTQSFSEYRIFGVEEVNSYILPFQFNSVLSSRIPAARLPLPLTTTLFSTLYKQDMVEKFLAIPYDSNADSAASVYFPFLRSTTPNRVSDEEVALLSKNSKLLNDLLALKVFEPDSVSVTRAKFYAKFVTTDFGSAVRTRFEQIFYGLTVSEDVPYIQYFTGRNEVARHKFYVKDPKVKKPYVDMSMWKSWTIRPPKRSQPTLLLFNGTSKESYDRISITATDITMTLFRSKSNNHKIPDMKKKALKWLKMFDAVMAFVDKDDIDSERWELQDIEFYADYSRPLDIDLRRFNCISSIFNKPDDQARFALLRTDRLNYGVNALQIKVIQLGKEGITSPQEVAKELNVTFEDANKILRQVDDLINEDPNLVERVFRGYPLIELGENEIRVSSVNEIDRILKYASILRYIVGFPDSKSLDTICPKRMETVKVDTGIAPIENFQIDADLENEYSDLFGYLEGDDEPEDKPVELPEQEKKINTRQKQFSKYSYFISRLVKFDPESFTSKQDKSYAKACEQNYQPIIISNNELDYIAETPYDPREYLDSDKMEDTNDPDGLIICPEYWCMKDEIPLTYDQLEKEDGEIRCPVCGNQLRTSDTDDPRKYTVIKREEGYNYPGFKKDIFKKTGKNMPCCFKTSQKKKVDKIDDKYYINRDDKSLLKELRVAFLSNELLQSLQINEKYELVKKTKRISNGISGFFRVGIGRPSQNLPELLGLKTKVESPREAVEAVMKCSFFRSFKRTGDSHLQSIENSLRKIPPYDKDDYVRKNIAKIISGIDEAFHKKELSVIEELEYSAIFLQCDIFRIFTNSNTLGCMFYSQIVRPRSRGIVILQNDRYIDILSYVVRSTRGFQYKSNIFELPFKKETAVILEKARNESCITKTPSYDDALNIIKEVLITSGKDTFQVVLDPFGRGQAFYIPDEMILPFNPVVLPDMSQTKIIGFNEISKEFLLSHENVLKNLQIASKYNEGYTFAEDLYNSTEESVEVLL
jgi:hypothetical protein